jgi:hypothetical protein
MSKYIGVKLIEAEPMTDCDFEKFKQHIVLPYREPRQGYKVVYPDGYTSWSPKDVFEEAYMETDGMTFGLAVEASKKGHKISRPGWNGRGMFVVYQKGYPQGIPCNKQTAEAWGMNEGDLFICQPYLQIKNVDGSHSMWVPSINDTLASDWMIVE